MLNINHANLCNKLKEYQISSLLPVSESIKEDVKDLKRNVKEGIESIKKDVKDVKKDVKEGTESIKKDVKEGTESIKEDLKDLKDVKRDVKDIQESIKKITKQTKLSTIGKLHLVGLCFTFNVLMNTGCKKKSKEST